MSCGQLQPPPAHPPEPSPLAPSLCPPPSVPWTFSWPWPLSPANSPTHVVDLLLILPVVPAVTHLREDLLGDVGHPAIAVLVPGARARRPPGCPGLGAHRGSQLSQVHRVPGVQGQCPAVVVVVVVAVGRVGPVMRVVDVRGVQGQGPRRPFVPGALAGPRPSTLRRQQGLVLRRQRLVLEAVPAGAAAGPGPAAAPRPAVGAPGAGLGEAGALVSPTV